jgi:hypothetical protein
MLGSLEAALRAQINKFMVQLHSFNKASAVVFSQEGKRGGRKKGAAWL